MTLLPDIERYIEANSPLATGKQCSISSAMPLGDDA
jgi:hypothetical protein